MPTRPRSHDVRPDSPEYVLAWARDILDAVGKREARKLLADYQTHAANKRLAKADQDIAAERVKALENLL